VPPAVALEKERNVARTPRTPPGDPRPPGPPLLLDLAIAPLGWKALSEKTAPCNTTFRIVTFKARDYLALYDRMELFAMLLRFYYRGDARGASLRLRTLGYIQHLNIRRSVNFAHSIRLLRYKDFKSLP